MTEVEVGDFIVHILKSNQKTASENFAATWVQFAEHASYQAEVAAIGPMQVANHVHSTRTSRGPQYPGRHAFVVH